MTDTTDHPSRRAGLRDEFAAALEAADYRPDMRRGDLADAIMPVLYREWPWLRAEAEGAASAVVPAADQAALRDRIAEEHRLALSMALGLGTGAPWDAIHDRVTELGLPPIDQDPVARRLGLVSADRGAVLAEVAATLKARHCSPESVALARRLVDERLCTDCEGYGQVVEDKSDGGVIRRCRGCNGQGLRRVAAETPPAAPGTQACAHCGRPITAPTAWISRPGSDGQRYYHLTVPACRAAACAHDAETPAAETLRPATTEWTFEACYDADNDKWHGVGGTYRDHDEAKDAFKRRTETDSGHVKHFKFRLVRATTTYTVEAEHTPAVEAQPGKDTETQPVGYSGKGRLWCLTCPRPDREDVPMTVDLVCVGELCAGCGRDVIDLARATQQPKEA